MTTGNTVKVPSKLVPIEIEKEIFSAAFRASMILEEDPSHDIARAALDAIVGMPTWWFATTDHQIVHRAVVVVHATSGGTVTPALVVQHLRKVGQLEGRGMLIAGLVGYGVAPIRGIAHHLEIVEHFARVRAEFIGARNTQAQILEDEAV